MKDDQFYNLLNSGLEHLIIAVDGTTQEKYSRYRKGGNLSLILKNIENLMLMKKEINNKTLFVELQFIDFFDDVEDFAFGFSEFDRMVATSPFHTALW